MSMRAFAAIALCALSACAQPPVSTSDENTVILEFPAMRNFPGRSPGPSTRNNIDIARDFLDLSFQMESGRTLPVLTRFEGPITVRIDGQLPQVAQRDLRALLARLRSEARIDIRLTTNAQANIVVVAVPNREVQRIAPNAACFVVPRVQSLSQLRAARNSPQLDWATLERRERAAIFIPSDVTPQEIRDCMHEELAQALGPINDLYRIPDTVFNDDNVHTVLTGFDMVVLRAYYDDALQSGMNRDAVAARLPAILNRINPRGTRGSPRFAPATPRSWKADIEFALNDTNSDRRRRLAALRAIDAAQNMGWTDNRAALAHYALGRAQFGNDPSQALAAFNTATQIYALSPETQLHAAFVGWQLAAFTLASGNAEATLDITNRAIPLARRHENGALLALLMMFQAEALDQTGDTAAGTDTRLDSLGWALYGFGDRETSIQRLNEIASLGAQTGPS